MKSVHRSEFSNNWKEEAWKNQGFNGIRTRDLRDTGAMLYQLSYKATHWERSQFIEFISPVRSEMMWSIYEIIHIRTAASSFRLLKLENSLRLSPFTFMYYRSSNMNYFVYTSHQFEEWCSMAVSKTLCKKRITFVLSTLHPLSRPLLPHTLPRG